VIKSRQCMHIIQLTISCLSRASTVDRCIGMWRTHLTYSGCSIPTDWLTLVTTVMAPTTKQTASEWAWVSYASNLVKVCCQWPTSRWVGDVTSTAAAMTSFFLNSLQHNTQLLEHTFIVCDNAFPSCQPISLSLTWPIHLVKDGAFYYLKNNNEIRSKHLHHENTVSITNRKHCCCVNCKRRTVKEWHTWLC